MTLSLRNTLIKVTLFISIALFTLNVVSIYYLKTIGIFSFSRLITIMEQNNLIIESLSNSLSWTLITTSVLFVFSIVTSFLLFHYFKKKISPEIFFFILFILSLSLQSIRLFQLHLLLLNFSPFFGVIITRIFYFFKLFGVFSLFASSLFPIGVKFQKFGTILLSIVLLSFTIAALMPIDPTALNINFLYRISDNSSIEIMTISVRVLTIVNFTRAALTMKSKNYLLILIASFLIITGDELLMVLPVPLLAFSFILAGTIIYSRSIYNYYLWI